MPERPLVYVHFEMGMSWPRQKKHHLTYTSKKTPDNSSRAAKQLLPASSSNAVTPHNRTHPGAHCRCCREHTQIATALPNRDITYMTGAGPFAHFPPHERPPKSRNQHRDPRHQPRHDNQSRRHRGSRPRSEGSVDRGKSAPPPMNENPWDAEPEPMTATALPTQSGYRGLTRKPLPPTPGKFRLGDEGMPWSSGQNIMTELTYAEEERESPSGTRQDGSKRILDDADRGRAKDIQNLATAMLTVDNGFEDQWWYHGTRLVNIAGDLISPAALAEIYESRSLPAWTMGSSVEARADESIPSPHNAGIVSPVSDLSSTERDYPRLIRSATIQSDELHL